MGGISALTSEKAAAVVGEGVKDAVGCHDRETRRVWSTSLQSISADLGEEVGCVGVCGGGEQKKKKEGETK